MDKVKDKLKRKLYYQKNREHILFCQRERRLKCGHRKYFRNFNIQAEMPVDLFIMRNKMKFDEGQRLDY